MPTEDLCFCLDQIYICCYSIFRCYLAACFILDTCARPPVYRLNKHVCFDVVMGSGACVRGLVLSLLCLSSAWTLNQTLWLNTTTTSTTTTTTTTSTTSTTTAAPQGFITQFRLTNVAYNHTASFIQVEYLLAANWSLTANVELNCDSFDFNQTGSVFSQVLLTQDQLDTNFVRMLNQTAMPGQLINCTGTAFNPIQPNQRPIHSSMELLMGI